MSWLAGQSCLITGGGSGLGRALVARFVAEGAHVGVLERSPEKIAALESDFGGAVVAARGDVADPAANEAAVAAMEQRFGALDCFIANAAICPAVIAGIGTFCSVVTRCCTA